MGLYKTIKGRGPWFTFFFTLFFGPVFAMMYVNRGWLAIMYLLITAILYFVLYTYFVPHIPAEQLDLINICLSIAMLAIGAPHASYIAYHFNKYEDIRWYSRIIPPLTVTFGLFIIFALTFRITLYEPFHIPSRSMEPNFSPDDLLFAKKSAYGYSQYSLPANIKIWDGRIYNKAPKRGDVAIFTLPDNTQLDYVKRIIGMPGDTIQMKNGLLFINGTDIDRKKIEPYQLTDDRLLDQYIETLPNGRSYKVLEEDDNRRLDNTSPFKVADGYYFMIGDNRDNSLDSRIFGAVHEDFLIGLVSIQIKDGRTGDYTFRNVENY